MFLCLSSVAITVFKIREYYTFFWYCLPRHSTTAIMITSFCSPGLSVPQNITIWFFDHSNDTKKNLIRKKSFCKYSEYSCWCHKQCCKTFSLIALFPQCRLAEIAVCTETLIKNHAKWNLPLKRKALPCMQRYEH